MPWPGRARRRRAQGRREGADLRAVRGLPGGLDRVPGRLRRPPRPRARSRSSTRCWTASARRTTPRRPSGRRSTSTTSSCAPATCSTTRRRAQRWAERFALIMIDEFQDTNAVQLGILRVARARQPVRGRRRVPVDLPLPPRRREHLPRPRARARPARGARPGGQLPQPRGAAGRAQRGVRARARRALLAAAGGPQGDCRSTSTARCGCSTLEPAAGAPPVELLVTGTQGWDELAPRLGLARRRRPAVAARRGAADRRPAARRARRRPPRRRHGRARPRDVVACGCSRRRSRSRACRPTWSAAAATGRQEQVRDGLAWLRVLANPHDEEALLTVLASPFHGAGHRRARPADRRTAARAAACGRRSRRADSRGRASCWPPSASTPSARRWRCCSSARSSPPATTSPCSPAPAATAGSRTCAS